MDVRLLGLVYDEHSIVMVAKVVRVEYQTRFGGINEDCRVVSSTGVRWPRVCEDHLLACVLGTLTQQHRHSRLTRGRGTSDMRDVILVQDSN